MSVIRDFVFFLKKLDYRRRHSCNFANKEVPKLRTRVGQESPGAHCSNRSHREKILGDCSIKFEL